MLLIALFLLVFGHSAAANSPTICNLKEQMDSHYGEGNWAYWTGTGTGTDSGAAISECIATFDDYHSRGRIYVPATGAFLLSTPNIDSSGVYFEGEGSQGSRVIIRLTSGAGFLWTGHDGISGGGMRGLNIALDGGLGSTTTTAVLFEGDAEFQTGQIELRDIYITALAGSTWAQGVIVNGYAKTTGAQGIRGGLFQNVQIFSCSFLGAAFNNAVQFSVDNLGVYVGSGTGADIYVAGGGSPTSNTTQIVLNNVISTNLNITNTTRFVVHGWGSQLQIDGSATHGVVWYQGTVAGACGVGCMINTF